LIILRLIGEFGSEFTGPSKQAYLLTKGLENRGISSIILTFKIGKVKLKRSKIIEYKPFFGAGHYKLSLKMLLDSLKKDCSIIHVHGYRNFQTDVGAISSFLKKVPLIITTHGTVRGYEFLNLDLKSRLPNIIYDAITMKLSLKIAKIIVATSKSEAKELISFGIPENKIRIISNGIEFPNINIKKENKETINLLTVSRLTYKNNLEMAIKAFYEAYKRNNKLRYIIVGDVIPSRYGKEEKGYKERLIKLCKDLGLQDKVIFKGWLSGEELWKVYCNSDLFIWSSRYDNFAHALVEAAYFKLPIISTPVGIAEELIGKEGGFIVNHENYKEMSERIIEIVENTKLMKEMGEHNHKQSLNYNYERMVEEYYKLYKEVLGFSINSFLSKNLLNSTIV
jgi:glycosyltransferase involved in cell wall biosynthesis